MRIKLSGSLSLYGMPEDGASNSSVSGLVSRTSRRPTCTNWIWREPTSNSKTSKWIAMGNGPNVPSGSGKTTAICVSAIITRIQQSSGGCLASCDSEQGFHPLEPETHIFCRPLAVTFVVPSSISTVARTLSDSSDASSFGTPSSAQANSTRANTTNEMRGTGGREKSNKCNQCDSTFSQAGHLRTHLRIHSGENPNKCNQCDYASSHARDLKTHLKIHSGEKSNK